MPSTAFFDVDDQDQSRVRAVFPDAQFLPASLRGDAIVDVCKDAEVISTFITTPFPREVIEKLPKLKLICTRSVGFDHIDLKACAERGIVVCHVPDYGAHVIAEHAFALLLGTMRHIWKGHQRVAAGKFEYQGLRGMALQDKTLGIIGTGKIGKKVAKIAYGFDMKILARDVYVAQELIDKFGVQYVELPELLAKSDIISLHAPAMAQTKHMINAETIAQMKDGVILVNTARGSLINTPDLLAALDSGKIAYALLDVLENEADMESDRRLVDHPHVVVTPHIAFYADDSIRTMYDDCIESIAQWQRGEKPAHEVKAV